MEGHTVIAAACLSVSDGCGHSMIHCTYPFFRCCRLQTFLKGRTEALRTVTPEVKAFLEAWCDPGQDIVSIGCDLTLDCLGSIRVTANESNNRDHACLLRMNADDGCGQKFCNLDDNLVVSQLLAHLLTIRTPRGLRRATL